MFALHALFCTFNARQRDIVCGEFYKLRSIERTESQPHYRGSVGVRTLGFSIVSFLFPPFWEWHYSGVLAIGIFATVMLSFLDAGSCRKSNC